MLVSCVLFVVALLPRAYVAARFGNEPIWDGHYYHYGAERIAGGFGYSEAIPGGASLPWSHYPVGYSGFLAAFYFVFGAKPVVGALAGALIGALTAGVVHRLALSFLSDVRAFAAGMLCALHPGLIVYAGLLMTEPLAGFGLMLAPLVFLRLRNRPVAAAAAAGIVLGLTTLVRPQSLLTAPFMGVLVPKKDRKQSAALLGAIATAVCLVTVAPWTLRNWHELGGFALVSTNGGQNLAIGASPHATGRFDDLTAEDGCSEATGEVAADRCWSTQGIAWIERDPLRWVALIPKKLHYTFDHQSFAIGYYGEADPDRFPEAKRRLYRSVLSFAQYILLFAAALAGVRRPTPGKRNGERWGFIGSVAALFGGGVLSGVRIVWPMVVLGTIGGLADFTRETRTRVVPYCALLVALLMAVHVVFFGEDRYQIIVTPALCLLAASLLRNP